MTTIEPSVQSMQQRGTLATSVHLAKNIEFIKLYHILHVIKSLYGVISFDMENIIYIFPLLYGSPIFSWITYYLSNSFMLLIC